VEGMIAEVAQHRTLDKFVLSTYVRR
jgi:hypothetical protein